MVTQKTLRAFAALGNKIDEEKTIIESLYETRSFISKHEVDLNDLLSTLNEDISALESTILSLQKEYDDQLPGIEAYIREIPDIVIRIAVRLYYVRGIPWKQTGELLLTTHHSIKAKVYRSSKPLKAGNQNEC